MQRETMRPTFSALRADTIAPPSHRGTVEASVYAETENDHERETIIPPASVAQRLTSATL